MKSARRARSRRAPAPARSSRVISSDEADLAVLPRGLIGRFGPVLGGKRAARGRRASRRASRFRRGDRRPGLGGGFLRSGLRGRGAGGLHRGPLHRGGGPGGAPCPPPPPDARLGVAGFLV